MIFHALLPLDSSGSAFFPTGGKGSVISQSHVPFPYFLLIKQGVSIISQYFAYKKSLI
jgi:hypothetical protein